ncbi:hypothetical protein [Pseudodonghicola flavimaris]|uniref:Uncharacterized protein n=1 Tax=Pseudodonghicola flavimaris TaxID=3050036 RepID=A0ABT7EWS8_9RHOB|nr:hypothetical protein [Pseudodonghicola flavimaris]MDK3016791.1 hypothetical protein [Pseudodonghicola flavimaris]
MRKLIAIINVIAWSGFWAFGYIAITTRELTAAQMTTAAIIACLGFLTGVLAYLKLCRGAVDSGIEPRRQLDPATRARAQADHPADYKADYQGSV